MGPGAEHVSHPAPGAPVFRRFVPRGWCPHLRGALCVSACPDGPGHGADDRPVGTRTPKAGRGGGLSPIYAEPGRLGVPGSPGSCVVPWPRQPSVRPLPTSPVFPAALVHPSSQCPQVSPDRWTFGCPSPVSSCSPPSDVLSSLWCSRLTPLPHQLLQPGILYYFRPGATPSPVSSTTPPFLPQPVSPSPSPTSPPSLVSCLSSVPS